MDIEFAEPEDVEEVTRDNCFNSSDTISFQNIFTTSSLSGAAALLQPSKQSVLAIVPLLAAGFLGTLL